MTWFLWLIEKITGRQLFTALPYEGPRDIARAIEEIETKTSARWFFSRQRIRDVVLEGTQTYSMLSQVKDSKARDKEWTRRMKVRLRGQPYGFNPALIWLIAQIVLPILLNWLIDNWSE